MFRSPDDNQILTAIRTEKKNLIELFDEGFITTEEYQDRLDGLYQRERGVWNEIDRAVLARKLPQTGLTKLLLFVLAGFLAGFFVSPHLYSKLFGYRNAEECALDKGTKLGAALCFRLYKRKDSDE